MDFVSFSLCFFPHRFCSESSEFHGNSFPVQSHLNFRPHNFASFLKWMIAALSYSCVNGWLCHAWMLECWIEMLGCWDAGILECWDVTGTLGAGMLGCCGMPRCRDAWMLGCWHAGMCLVLGCWNTGMLRCWNAWMLGRWWDAGMQECWNTAMLGRWNAGTLDIGMLGAEFWDVGTLDVMTSREVCV